MKIFKSKRLIHVNLDIVIVFALWLLLRILPLLKEWDWEAITWIVLICVVLGVVGSFFTWLLLKIFPSLKRLNWKIIAGSFFFLKLFDVHSTYLCFVKTEFYKAELNLVFQLFYKTFGFEPMRALFLSSIAVTIFGILLIKILTKKKCYFITIFLLVAVLLAIINNYIGYFFFI